ncbi:PIN domain nuclease [Spirilliplanes yamanashiensis]|uniref:Ribonuclease VapC n=1 Tax=Spirilliplanes yamanashiensis TaxID=42233 RepID=A0A8J3YDS2_9ACTN|nr:PIN domain nuclease [Spirilliplanes yamanashiensis]MDP9816527.1 putative nucleic acid-binding protein [Spirilliplanes yamanashiensis]GIJ06054.1 ribonuclease VapC18 [Spirilliplanes yamanashiensis]
MRQEQFLVDASALVRLTRDDTAIEMWGRQLTAGLLAVCPVTELEILYSARSPAHRDELRTLLREAFTGVLVPDRVWERAADVQAAMTDRGTHRSAGPVDLLVAACAELLDLTLLHYDADFDAVAVVTGQRTRWLAEPGSIA